MIALVVVVIDEGFDLGLQVTWQEVVFQQNAVLQSLVPSLNLTLGLGVIWRSSTMLHALVLQPFRQITRDVTGPVVAEQTWLVNDMDLITAGCL